jgi:hypothetical protein
MLRIPVLVSTNHNDCVVIRRGTFDARDLPGAGQQRGATRCKHDARQSSGLLPAVSRRGDRAEEKAHAPQECGNSVIVMSSRRAAGAYSCVTCARNGVSAEQTGAQHNA